MQKRTKVARIGVAGMALVFAACGSSSKSGAPSPSAADDTFVLSEFAITPPANTLHAGRVLITADNVGSEVHELVIVRAASAAGLPMKSDGSVDEDKIPESENLGEIEDVAARSRRSKTFDLTSGTYMAFCNIVDSMMGSDTTMMNGTSNTMHGTGSGEGHNHFAEGMRATFTVS